MVLVVHSITNKTGKIFNPLIGRTLRVLPSGWIGNTYTPVIHSFVVTFGTRVLRIVQWILKIPLGILSYTLRIIQNDSPEGGPKDPRILNIRVCTVYHGQ